ncbi:hypothetical protein [Oxalicibacterium faecigallinarum]|uniref:Uncharacterized protein n=1 Tax=Oxalicibacterium faecigallinarum TaxID=573741 RepID=A0A8J3AZS7_9BURK|nr:hypothetical protein [Oxalicibacterium faecigallinarum]GGI20938.1 hypothetical protein GCM10008066_26510 [Oxalicibacterium faecigallinarum]
MRRFIVICLILLFPLQVFADSAEDYPPAYALSGMDSQSDASCSTAPLQHLLPCNAATGKLVPAHLDFADILVPAPAIPLPLHEGSRLSVAPDSFLNATPVRLGKPPPSISSASHAAHILLDVVSARV